MSDSDHNAFLAAENKRRKRLALVIGALVVLPAGFFVVSDLRLMLVRRAERLSPEQRGALAGLLDARDRQGAQRVAQWNAAIERHALEALRFADEPCPVSLAAPTPASAASHVKFGIRDSAFGDWALCLLRPDSKSNACDQSWDMGKDAAKLRARLAEGDVYTWDLEAAKNAPPTVEPARVLVLVETETPFKLREAIVGRLSFVPAALAGRAFLFLPAEGRFVCGASVTAQNSKHVEAEFDHLGGKPSAQETDDEARAALRRDLEVRVRLELPPAWRRLGE